MSTPSGAELAFYSPGLLASFASAGRWKSAAHLRLLDRQLVRLERREITRLVVCFPPRHGKTELASRHFPAWWLGHNPLDELMLLSYEFNFAASHGEKARDIYRDHIPAVFPGRSLASRHEPAAGWNTDLGGSMKCSGIGGAITGKGANALIVDDPVKNAEQANSETYKSNAFEWFNSTVYTRLQPDAVGRPAVAMVIQTRWAEDDLAGRLVANGLSGDGDMWDLFELPAIAMDPEALRANGKPYGPDALGRAAGEPLWPERFPLERLIAIQRQLGSYWWNALYQQAPGDPAGGIFKRRDFKYFKLESYDGASWIVPQDATPIPLKSCIVQQTVDLANSMADIAAYTVVETCALHAPTRKRYVLDIRRVRLEGSAEVLSMLAQAQRDWNAVSIGVEKSALSRIIVDARRAGLPIQALIADADKLTRALPLAAAYEAGQHYHRAGAEWLAEFEKEHLAFPNGAFKDQVDANAYQVLQMAGGDTWGVIDNRRPR